MREVTIWGRLSHPGIVRYHTSWVETETTSTNVKQALGLLRSRSASDDTANGTDSDDDDGEERERSDSLEEEDFDLGFDDLDFISTGQQNRSISMPTIHFGNEEDPSNEPIRIATRIATPDLYDKDANASMTTAKQSRTLYMQMEAS